MDGVQTGILQLNSITTNGKESKNVRPKYYANDDKFAIAKEMTKNSPEVHGETAVIDISDRNASARDLQARDILAKWIGGVSGFKQIMGSKLEKEFIEANKDDFKQTGTVVRDGKEYPVYSFNKETSDGKVSMPTLQKDDDGKEFYMMSGKSFKADGSRTDGKFVDKSYNQDGTMDDVYKHPDGSYELKDGGVYDWNLYGS